jgi:hypothetical protein
MMGTRTPTPRVRDEIRDEGGEGIEEPSRVTAETDDFTGETWREDEKSV